MYSFFVVKQIREMKAKAKKRTVRQFEGDFKIGKKNEGKNVLI